MDQLIVLALRLYGLGSSIEDLGCEVTTRALRIQGSGIRI